MESGFVVPGKSWGEIERIALAVRETFGLRNVDYFPVMDVIEKRLQAMIDHFHFVVGDDEMMEGAEGYSDPNGEFIALHESVYRQAWEGRGRERFTAAHELGHWVLHSGARLQRVSPLRRVSAYRLSEPQADHFAAALLMPAHLVDLTEMLALMAKRFGVTVSAAAKRRHYLKWRPRV